MTAAPTVAVVPVRSPGTGKTRLAPALSTVERAQLAGAMLADVTAALRGAAGVDRLVVAASGPAAAAAAATLGVDVLLDPPSIRGLDAAVHAAASRIGPAAALLVVTADLPRLEPGDVDTVLAHGAQVVVVPTDDGGTGALLRRPPGVIGTAYGPRSGRRHVALARSAGVDVAELTLPGFRHDVDTWEDIRDLRRGSVGSATAAFLDTIADRLEATG